MCENESFKKRCSLSSNNISTNKNTKRMKLSVVKMELLCHGLSPHKCEGLEKGLEKATWGASHHYRKPWSQIVPGWVRSTLRARISTGNGYGVLV